MSRSQSGSPNVHRPTNLYPYSSSAEQLGRSNDSIAPMALPDEDSPTERYSTSSPSLVTRSPNQPSVTHELRPRVTGRQAQRSQAQRHIGVRRSPVGDRRYYPSYLERGLPTSGSPREVSLPSHETNRTHGSNVHPPSHPASKPPQHHPEGHSLYTRGNIRRPLDSACPYSPHSMNGGQVRAVGGRSAPGGRGNTYVIEHSRKQRGAPKVGSLGAPDPNYSPSQRPMSFVRALEMTEVLETKEQEQRQTPEPKRHNSEQKQRSIYDSSYEITV